MTAEQAQQPPLRGEEWNFSRVADRELEACFHWECAREWGDFEHELSNFAEAGGESIEDATNIRNATALLGLRFHSEPWQLLPLEERDEVIDMTNPGLWQIHYYALDAWLDDLRKAKSGVAAFRINWHETDHRLLSDFAAWLKAHRKQAPREGRGSTTRDLLKMLGAMRLLHHYPFDTAYALTVSELGTPLYGKRASWDRARMGALEAFREKFFVDWGAFVKPPFPKSFPRQSQKERTA